MMQEWYLFCVSQTMIMHCALSNQQTRDKPAVRKSIHKGIKPQLTDCIM